MIANLIGKIPLYFRPPYGSINDRVNNIAKALDLKTILWSCRSVDSSTEPTVILDGSLIYTYGPVDFHNNIIRNTGNGSIILCHDGHTGTHEANFGIVSALDKVIPELQKKNLIL